MPLPELPLSVTREQIKEALSALGITDRVGVHRFEADLHKVTIHRHMRDNDGRATDGEEVTSIPISGAGVIKVADLGSMYDSDRWPRRAV
jgi:hypothetical protein